MKKQPKLEARRKSMKERKNISRLSTYQRPTWSEKRMQIKNG